MRPLVLVLVLVLVLAAGCATTIRVEGPGDADLHARNPSAQEFTYVGRKTGDPYVYKVPAEFENRKIIVLVKTDKGAWKYTVFTDRDVVIHFPPKGPTGVGIGAIEAVLPEAPAPKPKPPAPKPAEEPSATLSD